MSGPAGETANNKGNGILRAQMPELDTLRGVAILAVFLYHGLYVQPGLAEWNKPWRLVLTAAWPGRWGVNLFFVLSGFLISGILLESAPRPDYYARFYKRRALRILPAYLAVLGILALTPWVTAPPLWFSLFFLSNLTSLFGVVIGYHVLWSLAVEEHFYFLWPAVCRNFSLARLTQFCVAVIVLSPLSRCLSLRWGSAFTGYRWNEYTWNSLDGLACGALVAIWLRRSAVSRKDFAKWGTILLGGSLVAWCVGVPLGILSRQGWVGAAFQMTVLNAGLTGILGLVLLAGSGEYHRLVENRFLQFLGYISYGLYLVHILAFWCFDVAVTGHIGNVPANRPGYLLTRTMVVGICSVTVAYLSRKYFEEWFLTRKGS